MVCAVAESLGKEGVFPALFLPSIESIPQFLQGMYSNS